MQTHEENRAEVRELSDEACRRDGKCPDRPGDGTICPPCFARWALAAFPTMEVE